jgi:deazaflavin-dependent oxidoreductase (nitroreductase family)
MGGFMVIKAVGSVAGVIVLVLAVFVIGMRLKLAPVRNAVRRVNRTVTNPRVLRTAGTAGEQTSVIRHVGRTSGRPYQTPVDLVPTRTGFLIALPYGSQADWVRNVLAAGSATVVTDGESLEVDRPTIVATADVADLIPSRTLRTLRLFGVNECLHLERASSQA